MVDVLDASFPGPHVPTVGTQLTHPRQRQLSQVPLLHPARHQRHGNIALDTIDSHLRRHTLRQPFSSALLPARLVQQLLLGRSLASSLLQESCWPGHFAFRVSRLQAASQAPHSAENYDWTF